MDITVMRRLLHLMYPSRCPVCGQAIGAMEHFCRDCRKDLVPFTDRFTIAGAESFFAAFEYNEAVSPAVILLKRGLCGNGAYALGGALAEVLRDSPARSAALIVPAPLHSTDRKERGCNQSELIAAETGRLLSIPVRRDILRKSGETLPQKTLTKRERQVNLRGAFEVSRPELIKGRKVLLIDDVCTTGSTLAELTAVLKAAGAETVWCAACCKTPILKENEVTDHV